VDRGKRAQREWVAWAASIAFLDLSKKKISSDREEYRSVLSHKEREAVSRIEGFFKPLYGLVSTKSKALSMKRA
jgi:hypothetical protein